MNRKESEKRTMWKYEGSEPIAIENYTKEELIDLCHQLMIETDYLHYKQEPPGNKIPLFEDNVLNEMIQDYENIT